MTHVQFPPLPGAPFSTAPTLLHLAPAIGLSLPGAVIDDRSVFGRATVAVAAAVQEALTEAIADQVAALVAATGLPDETTEEVAASSAAIAAHLRYAVAARLAVAP